MRKQTRRRDRATPWALMNRDGSTERNPQFWGTNCRRTWPAANTALAATPDKRCRRRAPLIARMGQQGNRTDGPRGRRQRRHGRFRHAIAGGWRRDGCRVIAVDPANNAPNASAAFGSATKPASIGFAPLDVTRFRRLRRAGAQASRPSTAARHPSSTPPASPATAPCARWTSRSGTRCSASTSDGVFNLCRPAVEGMATRGFGRIVNISSVNGQTGQFGQTNYAAAKAGMHGFTMALAREVARKGVTVNSVSLGYCATALVMAMSEEIRADIVSKVPVGRLGEPDEIARTVPSSPPRDAGFITGANIPVNGGLFMSF